MIYQPNSDLWFTSVKFDETMDHVTDDPNFITKMQTKAYTVPEHNYSYIRENNTIVVKRNYEELLKYNYLIYINQNYNGKYICAFITKMDFLAENSTRIYLKTDYYHTYKDQIEPLSSFIERAHVAKHDDVKGWYTQSEGIDTGSYIIDSEEEELFSGDVAIAVMVKAVMKTDDEGSVLDPILGHFKAIEGGLYQGIPLSYKIYVFGKENAQDYFDFIKKYVERGGEEHILAVYTVPRDFIDNELKPGYYEVIKPARDWVTKQVSLLDDTIDGYTPKNNKLFTYPYCYARMQNGNGTQKILKFEDFNVPNAPYGTLVFQSRANVISGAPVVKTYTGFAKNYFDNDDFLILSGYPQLPWSSNGYQSWLANNSGNIVSQITGLGITIGAIASGGAMAGAVAGVTSLLGGMADKSKQISKSEGSLSGNSVDLTTGRLKNTVAKYSVRKEYAKIIDNFFTMYGYRISENRVPQLRNRPRFNYIKTNGFNFRLQAPAEAKKEIKSIFDKGVTIWHVEETMMDYTMDNY